MTPPTSAFRVLVADDQPDVREAIRLLLKTEGFVIEAVGSPAAAAAAIGSADFDVFLMDLNYARDTTSGREGLELIETVRLSNPALPAVVMTAWGSIEIAVEAMRRGARDFITKPWDNARLLAILRTQAELARAVRSARRLEEENRRLLREGSVPLVAESDAMRSILEIVLRVAPTDAPVLITGENGVGKSVVARLLHDRSLRSGGPLVIVDAGGLSESLFESELFGHVRGAFTDAKTDRPGRFEISDGGTLFLDEIGNVPLSLQPKLLRVLESGEFEAVGSSRTRHVNVRVISATNADIRQLVAAGRFRQDLLFRLNTVEIPIPPLRDRRADIPVLAQESLIRHAAHYRKAVAGFSEDASAVLREYPWPGNIRELDHAVERAVLLCTSDTIRPPDLGLRPSEASDRLDDMSLEDVERILIRKAIDRANGSVSSAADALGLSRSALYRRIRKHGL